MIMVEETLFVIQEQLQQGIASSEPDHTGENREQIREAISIHCTRCNWQKTEFKQHLERGTDTGNEYTEKMIASLFKCMICHIPEFIEGHDAWLEE